ncbi:MAG: type IX secretion system protein PorQ [Flavobacteriales bacterium]|nr:type IX secretion system protein PorQ [Flavobacteriales bacterium]MCB9194203.1 type IX secretion system protein PorQ [Flavobacteriales bacterium]
MTKPSILLAFACALTMSVKAQLGGQSAFHVLDIPSSARVSALGGTYPALMDDDLNLGIFNPALLNASMSKQVALSYLPYFDGIQLGFGSYAHHFDSIRTTFSGTVQFLDYGTFDRTDETGAELGTFHAGEYVFQVGAAHPIDSLFSVGANVKFITSQLAGYNSTAWALDLGGVFAKPIKGITIAVLLRNIGYQTSSYTDQREELPFNAELGITYKFRHAPFRLGLVYENIQQWDLSYDDPVQQATIDPTTGETIIKKTTFGQKLTYHLVPSAEVVFGRYFMARLGFNFRRRHELQVEGKPGIAGLSFGLGLRVSKFHLSYGFAKYHLAGISNTITLSTHFSDFKRKAG